MTTTATSTAGVVGAIRAVGTDRRKLRELMNTLYAETVHIEHEPPLASDGPVPSSTLIALSAQEVAALERAMPDAVMHASEVAVEGDDGIRVRNRMSGTLPDGSRVELLTNTVLRVADGRIVGLRSEMAPEDLKVWANVLAAGKFEIPPDLLPPRAP